MAEFLTKDRLKRWQGTYRIIPKVDWIALLEHEFGAPDWTALYPLNSKGLPTNTLSPRMACKLFHDSIYIIKKTEENQRFIHDRLPDISHRFYKKKQWRKQFFEAMRRVACRLARGLAFRNNCLGEDAFVHIVLSMTFELGWRRINQFIEPLPESEVDRDFNRITRFATNEDISALMRGTDPTKEAETEAKKKKTVTAPTGKTDVRDVRGWFKMYDAGSEHMFDHIVQMHLDEIEGSSMTSSEDNRSRSSTLDSEDPHHHHEFSSLSPHHHDHIQTLPPLAEAAEGTEAAEAEVPAAAAAVAEVH